MLPYQIKGARILLRISRRVLAEKLHVGSRTVSKYERVRGACPQATCLGIRFLLVEAGLYAHFRMLYMRKDKTRWPLTPTEPIPKSEQKNKLLLDALAYKYDK